MRRWIRLDKDQYNNLLRLVTLLIEKQDTKMRKAVTAGERLTLTLGYLATGDTRLGLLWTCETLYNRSQVCYAPSLGGAWLVTLGCVLLGCVCVTATIVLLALSHCRISLYIMAYARWVGFTAMVLFCLAAVVFPMGFYVEEIGGEPYQLPNSFQVGYSYIFFVLALWMTVVSELFAGKVCLPNF
ncbi:putative uncharacterized protein C16orf52-like A [Penaeus vannamei]|uniref:Uncharacterized protein n=1 Tax=Penaeus vannamei TaxID=6689 RepID=A0A3R7MZG5_PENVA|nr:modulator of smoothened protein-like [Penaeus vannamei]ROT73336.1 putative uncharacterized protein C16orf52-like A [Penaeus vannamei]